ncbi:MAG TPA: TIGR02302 family protein [Methylocella sp.]|nr:TIGR02302 family protein [Methylocella sp.]
MLNLTLEPSPASDAALLRRFRSLLFKARAVILFERIWRSLIPPFIVAGTFVCVSWTGIWLNAPPWARGIGSAGLAFGLIAALLPARKFRLPSRKDAIARIDRISGLAARPAAAMTDKLANGDDPATRALWNLHRRQAERAITLLRVGLPEPRAPDIDRFALRASVTVALIAMAFVAGPERHARLAAAFDWRLDAPRVSVSRIDAWIDPPAYTGKPPLVLHLASGALFGPPVKPQHVETPINSTIVLHAPGGSLDLDIKGPLVTAETDKPQRKDETRLLLQGDASLTFGHLGARLGAFNLHAIPDEPPSIDLSAPPRSNLRGSITLKYRVADDYGVASAEANFAKPILPGNAPVHRSLAEPPKIALLLPPGAGGSGEAETTADLSDHPWAGTRVEMTLVARDEGGNTGKSAPIEVTLPQKPFANPLAAALAEQRRNLLLAPDDKPRVADALEGLMIAPDVFGTSASIYLGLRVAADVLNAVRGDGDLIEVADLLWQMALRIENGGLSEAERQLRAAEQQLRDALQRGASEDEIRKLSENLRAAMDKFLRELAQRQSPGERDASALDGKSRGITPKQLQDMLDKMQEALRSGDSASAQQMLEQLQNILENLKIAKPRQRDPRSQALNQALDELGRLSQEQQDLRDETYQSGQEERHEQREESGQFGLPGQQTFEDFFGEGPEQHQGKGGMEPNGRRAAPEGGNKQSGGQSNRTLAQRQQNLRGDLEKLQEHLGDAGAGSDPLSGANKAMREAEDALGRSKGDVANAVDAQGRAVDALRQGADKLAEAMRSKGEGEESGEEEPGAGRYGSGNGTDPLGRPMGRERAFNPAARYDPMGVPAAERARRVLEELRRRLGEPARPREEMDYLERLLRRY